MDGFITPQLVKLVRRIVDDPSYKESIVEHNYSVANKYYSYTVLRRLLRQHIAQLTGDAPDEFLPKRERGEHN